MEEFWHTGQSFLLRQKIRQRFALLFCHWYNTKCKEKNKKNSKKCYHPKIFKHIVFVRNNRGRLAQLVRASGSTPQGVRSQRYEADLASNRKWL